MLNFDLPFSARSYTHRVGRTARAGRTGTSLSFIVPREQWGKLKKNDVSLPTAKYDDKVWARIEKSQKSKGGEVKEYKFDLKQVEGFRYRMEDGLRSVTKAAVREARIKEIKNEVVNSEKLKVRSSSFSVRPDPSVDLTWDCRACFSRLTLKTIPEIWPSCATINRSTRPEFNPISNTCPVT